MPLTLMNYVLQGLIPESLDHCYLESFKVMFVLLLAFNGVVSSLYAIVSDPANNWVGSNRLQYHAPPSRKAKLLQRHAEVIPMDAYVHRLLRWDFAAPLQSHPMPLLFYSYGVELYS